QTNVETTVRAAGFGAAAEVAVEVLRGYELHFHSPCGLHSEPSLNFSRAPLEHSVGAQDVAHAGADIPGCSPIRRRGGWASAVDASAGAEPPHLQVTPTVGDLWVMDAGLGQLGEGGIQTFVTHSDWLPAQFSLDGLDRGTVDGNAEAP